MNIQKVYKNGNSLVVSIPGSLLKEKGIRDGSSVTVESGSGDEIVVRRVVKSAQDAKEKNFAELLEKVNKNYGPALKELAKK